MVLRFGIKFWVLMRFWYLDSIFGILVWLRVSPPPSFPPSFPPSHDRDRVRRFGVGSIFEKVLGIGIKFRVLISYWFKLWIWNY